MYHPVWVSGDEGQSIGQTGWIASVEMLRHRMCVWLPIGRLLVSPVLGHILNKQRVRTSPTSPLSFLGLKSSLPRSKEHSRTQAGITVITMCQRSAICLTKSAPWTVSADVHRPPKLATTLPLSLPLFFASTRCFSHFRPGPTAAAASTREGLPLEDDGPSESTG